ncbi:MAG: CRISPR-associated ring nuclease Csm6 [Moraxella sp.]|nr:CRISPR-associated ring nuclease Csm6 [Moraxella sp.]
MKKILFLVTGMTPQIITETAWALAFADDNPWIADEIHVLSTSDGLNQIKARLLYEQDGQPAGFARFRQDYPVFENTIFDDGCLHEIVGHDGVPLTDLKTPTDNELAADLICKKVREFTERDDVELHVSIAGGRKTMGFYAGYALSLYGRANDGLSHVLVDERFETARDFLHPTPDNFFVADRDGKRHNAKDAHIWLARIPFVRMREAINPKHQLSKGDKFSEVVAKVNESFKELYLTINVDNQTINVNNRFDMKLSPREFAFLWWFADLRCQGKDGVIAPKIDSTAKHASEADSEHLSKLTDEFKRYYNEFKDSREFCMDKKTFSAIKSLLNTSLAECLGVELAAKIDIVQDGRGSPFYLNLPANTIKIVDNFDKNIV